jgi:hypothetical protein
MIYRWVIWIALAQQGWQGFGDPEKQGLDCLRRYSAAVNMLNPSPGGRPVDARRREILENWFSAADMPVPDVLQPADSYRNTLPQLPAGQWLAQLPGFFWEGFSYRLDSLRLDRPVTSRDSVVFVASVRLHGLQAATKTKVDFCENQMFTLRIKGKSCVIEDIRGLGTGFREPLSGKRLKEVYTEFAVLLRELVSEATGATRRREILDLFSRWLPLDAACCQVSGERRSLHEIAALRLAPERAAGLEIKRLDIRQSGNYYIDRDGSLNADFLGFQGVTSWRDAYPECASRQQSTRKLPDGRRPGDPVEIANVVLDF